MEWADHDGPLPTKPGCIPGIIEAWKGRYGVMWATAQCAVCYRTCTDKQIFSMWEISNRGDVYGTVPYRRSPVLR